MDPATISLIAAGTIAALRPYLEIFAAKAADAIASEVPDAIRNLWTALRNRTDTKEAAREAVDDLLKDPANEAFQTVFRVQLEKLLLQDDEFANRVKKLVEESHSEYRADSGAIAVGRHAKAVGEGGILVEGDVGGDVIGAGGSKHG